MPLKESPPNVRLMLSEYDSTKIAFISSCPSIGGFHAWLTVDIRVAIAPVGVPSEWVARSQVSAKQVPCSNSPLTHATDQINGYIPIFTRLLTSVLFIGHPLPQEPLEP